MPLTTLRDRFQLRLADFQNPLFQQSLVFIYEISGRSLRLQHKADILCDLRYIVVVELCFSYENSWNQDYRTSMQLCAHLTLTLKSTSAITFLLLINVPVTLWDFLLHFELTLRHLSDSLKLLWRILIHTWALQPLSNSYWQHKLYQEHFPPTNIQLLF